MNPIISPSMSQIGPGVITNFPNQTLPTVQDKPFQIIQDRKCPSLKKSIEILKQSPFTVFSIILLFTIMLLILTVLAILRIFFRFHYIKFHCSIQLIFHSLFVYYVWFPLAREIEKTSGSTRYLIIFLFNFGIIQLGSMLIFFWQYKYTQCLCFFIEFETILVTLVNKDKKLDFFYWRISNKFSPFLIVLYYLFVTRFFHPYPIIIGLYALFYEKFLMNHLAISNEKIMSIENCCCIKMIVNKFKSYVKIEETITECATNQEPPQPSMIVNNISNPNNYPEVPQNETSNVSVSDIPVYDINEQYNCVDRSNGWVNIDKGVNQTPI